MTSMTGGCQCGAVRYTAEIFSDDAYLCHCTMCRRATGNVAAAFTNIGQADVRWHGGPDWYRSSPIAERPFCAKCGTPLGFRYLDSGKIDLAIGSFDDPARFRPTSNFSCETILPGWSDTSALGGQRLDDYAPLAEKWRQAGVEHP